MKLLAAVLYAICSFSSHTGASADRDVSKKHSRPNVHDTSECWYDEQRLDHFTYTKRDERWRQRYLLHQGYWTRGGPIFFYGRLHVGMPTFSIQTTLPDNWCTGIYIMESSEWFPPLQWAMRQMWRCMPITQASCGRAQRTLGRLWSLQRYESMTCRLITYQNRLCFALYAS